MNITITIKANIRKLGTDMYYEDQINPWSVQVGMTKYTFKSWEAAARKLSTIARKAANQ